ncbi:hypothetical protein, partial [Facilibium subflavum]|uniref:hypothetical protein n=1 Tax=Facilibium subflavum TaxID=2219058 RepID=UPI0013C2D3AE
MRLHKMKTVVFIGVFFLINLVFAGQDDYMTNKDFVNSVLSQTDTSDNSVDQQSTGWFYINVYGGGSYKSFPQAKQVELQPWGSDDVYQPAKRWSSYLAIEFGVQPWRYLSFSVRYWDAGSSSAALDNDNGVVIQSNGENNMAFSGVDIAMRAHFPIPSINSEILLSTGPSVNGTKL